jgi:hypothetical protein
MNKITSHTKISQTRRNLMVATIDFSDREWWSTFLGYKYLARMRKFRSMYIFNTDDFVIYATDLMSVILKIPMQN